MTAYKFVCTLPNGRVQTSDFSGWQIELRMFIGRGSRAAFQLTKDDQPDLYLVCYDCWPLPTKLKWRVNSLSFNRQGDDSIICDSGHEIHCGACYIAFEYNPLEDPDRPCTMSENILFKNWGIPVDGCEER